MIYLRHALVELLNEYGSIDNVYGNKAYQCSIYEEIERETISWPYNLQSLINFRNWNLRRLLDDHGNIRKPKAFFKLYITDKDNLVLDWYPASNFTPCRPARRTDLEQTDWVYFSSDWYGSYPPENRAIMIRDFGNAFIYRHKKIFDGVDSLLLSAIRSLISDIYRFAGYFVEVIRVTDLYLIESDKPFFPPETVSVKIRNVEDVRKEAELKHQKDWIRAVCKEFGSTPELFLENFKENEMKYAPTARKLSTKSKRLTEDRLKKIVRGLYDFPEIYDAILSEPPKGVSPRRLGK